MTDFKIGDKVKFKSSDKFLGYVSSVYKGQLFLIDDYEITVHIGNQVHVIVKASNLEVCDE